MWKMLDTMMDADLFMFDCDECAGMPLAPPPQFLMPPPPRPPALAEYTVVPQDCNEEQLAQQQWESDVCQAMPILDASLYSSQSLATSAMIAVFSLLLVLIVLISSLFVWKNKRKVQNLLPCKTPTRGALSSTLPLGGGGGGSHGGQHHHHAMYEDPDAHLGHHRPLVMRHHQYQQHPHHQHPHHHHHHHHHYQQHPHAELLQGKSIHYPSGYPMTRSPPFLVSSSPGPDPYRSNDNVYEELGPGRVDSDGESEPPLHSDDDFAEDELSLPGECSFHKEANSIPLTSTAPASTPYHERASGSSGSSAAVGAAGMQVPPPPQERHSGLSSGSSTAQDASTASASASSSHNNNINNNNSNSHELASGGPLRRTPRSRQQRAQDELNNSSSTAEIADLAPLYDNRSNMMSLGYLARSTAPQFYNTLEHEVERRNRINAQLSRAPVPPLATIYRERIRYPSVQQYAPNSANGLLAATMRARTQPRLVDRRLAAHQHQHHRIHAAPLATEPAYGYAEPMYNANYYYDSVGAGAGASGSARPYASTLLPTTTTTTTAAAADYRQPYGDSSFGSDSGYSHHTPASSIGRQDYDLAEPQMQPKPSKLSAALSFGWHRARKTTATPIASISSSSNSNSNNEATSPNNNSNNSACSTVTSQLDNNNAASLSPA
ncbi:dendritic arbor reduction protein 1 [Drosophila novamexicana]|uniref:dendritic arbor reduction protein 1 n=1 Tax=Drosophila novamexicana TaxID=47314 RepID=UPI0011E5AD85|nr:dendritic arbor reduction protein 1 [Drosophila novamexicana]